MITISSDQAADLLDAEDVFFVTEGVVLFTGFLVLLEAVELRVPPELDFFFVEEDFTEEGLAGPAFSLLSAWAFSFGSSSSLAT